MNKNNGKKPSANVESAKTAKPVNTPKQEANTKPGKDVKKK